MPLMNETKDKLYKVTTKRTIEQVRIEYIDDTTSDGAMDIAESRVIEEDDPNCQSEWKTIKDEIDLFNMKCVELFVKEVRDAVEP